MNIIDTLKAKAFTAFHCAEVCASCPDNRESAISWWGEGVGLIKAIHALLGSYVDTKSLESARDRISEKIWPTEGDN